MAKSTIALYGASGVGTTTLISMLATTFAKKGENVAIVLDDILYCPLPLFTSNFDSSKSLGKLLNMTIGDSSKVTDEVLFHSMQTTKLPQVGIFSYMVGETETTYEKYTISIAEKFLDRISGLSEIDYMLIGCRSSVSESPLTNVAFRKADIVLHVANPSMKCRQYRKSQQTLLKQRNSNFKDFLVLMNVYKGDPVEDFLAVEKLSKGSTFIFEHNEDLFCQLRDGALLTDLNEFGNKSNQRVNQELNKLCSFIESYEPMIDEWEEEWNESIQAEENSDSFEE